MPSPKDTISPFSAFHSPIARELADALSKHAQVMPFLDDRRVHFATPSPGRHHHRRFLLHSARREESQPQWRCVRAMPRSARKGRMARYVDARPKAFYYSHRREDAF